MWGNAWFGWHASLAGLPPHTMHGNPIPDYLHSLDACKELIEEMAGYGHVQIENEWVCKFDGNDETFTKYLDVQGNHQNICEAICNCYIAWKEAQNE